MYEAVSSTWIRGQSSPMVSPVAKGACVNPFQCSQTMLLPINYLIDIHKWQGSLVLFTWHEIHTKSVNIFNFSSRFILTFQMFIIMVVHKKGTVIPAITERAETDSLMLYPNKHLYS